MTMCASEEKLLQGATGILRGRVYPVAKTIQLLPTTAVLFVDHLHDHLDIVFFIKYTHTSTSLTH